MRKRIQKAFILMFLLALSVTLVTPSGFCEPLKRVILIETMPVKAVLESTKWFKIQLTELGWVFEKNMDLLILTADGSREKAERELKAALAEVKADLVVSNATLASQVVANILRGTDIPQVFFTVGAPVKAGLIDKIGIATGRNITGKVKMLDPQVRLDIIAQLAKQSVDKSIIRFGYIYPTYPSSIGDLQKLRAIAETREDVQFKTFDLKYREVPAGTPVMLKEAIRGIQLLENQIDFWWESAGPLGETSDYTRTLLNYSSKPIIFGHRMESVKMGALVSFVVSLEANGRETAILADRILKGADAGTIPVTPPTAFHFGINLTTALNLNIPISPGLMELAGKNIFR